jgi:hypothetical protein
MTIQDWAIIVIAISAPIAAFATLFAPSLAEIVKFRINQPKPSPDPNQPENLIQRKGGRSLKRMFWFPVLLCAGEIWLLVRVLRSPAPIDKASVLTISFLASSVMFVIAAIALVYLGKVMVESFKIHLEIHQVQSERVGQLATFVMGIARSLTAALDDDTTQAKQILEDLRVALTVKPDSIQSK